MLSQSKGGEDIEETLKELDEGDVSQEDANEAREDFRRECSVLRSLRHPNIV
jgi:hypothetical protein